MANQTGNSGGSGSTRAVDQIPLDKRSMAWALKHRRQLIEAGKPLEAQKFMQRWRSAQGD